MSVLAGEETNNAAFVSSLSNAQASQPALPPNPPSQQTPAPTVGALNARFPASATKVQLNSILSHNPKHKATK